ncbi:MAG: hypothetical protein PHP95_11525 [Desulfuromonadaceae bacterium]|nr:hypothetical protein [Desulfuromonadaceae bacterium]MDD2849077.1 hypothetical protein [Desulfuromonadaceae bacterium]MDD4131765.1 hypothetical protein [Desulfuromonadaceae bacterium]
MHDYVKPVFFVLMVVLLVPAISGGVMAANRGRMVAAWSILCALLPPLLLLLYFARPLREVEGKYKRCPGCSELLKWHDQVCKYCYAAQVATESTTTLPHRHTS